MIRLQKTSLFDEQEGELRWGISLCRYYYIISYSMSTAHCRVVWNGPIPRPRMESAVAGGKKNYRKITTFSGGQDAHELNVQLYWTAEVFFKHFASCIKLLLESSDTGGKSGHQAESIVCH